MKRRSFITASVFGAAFGIRAVSQAYANTSLRSVVPDSGSATDDESGNSTARLARIVNAAQMGGWVALPIGERMMKIAQHFVDVPYVGGTLEGDTEECRIDLEGLDCVTFFEDTLGIARMLEHGGSGISDLRKEITFTRYRGGQLHGYVSRLHYTAEWIADNIVKKVITDVTSDIGGEPLSINVNFMSTHPQYYAQLKEHPEFIAQIAGIERIINSIPRTYVRKEHIESIEGKLMSGDIIAIATNKAGLDYAHTGMINVVDGVAHFMHASTTQKKVILDGSISAYVNSVKSHTGITVVRPI